MSSESLKAVACGAIDAASAELHLLSRDIWQNPELFYQEHHAHKIITDFLEKKGFAVERRHHLETAFRASHGEGRPNIAVLCEYDALPEIGHACGHNLIAELGVAAGIGIKAAIEAASQPIGQVTVLGTPAEEAGGGKVDLINAGTFRHIDAALMAHPGKHNTIDTPVLALTKVRATFRGHAVHAASAPWEGINALDAAVNAYQSISNMRQQIKPTWRIHGIFSKGGVAPNIIPEEAELYYFLRAPTKSELTQLIQKVTACFEGAATAAGSTVELVWDPKPYFNVLTNKTIETLYKANAESLGVEFSEDEVILKKPTGSTDMGNLTHEVPGMHPHFYIGTQHVAHSHPFATASGSEEAQIYTIQQGKALAMTAIDLLCDSNKVQEMKEGFKKDKEIAS